MTLNHVMKWGLMSEEQERGKWQKAFVKKLVDQGFTHEHAMIAMALTCEERQNAYMDGYNKGFNEGNKLHS